MTSRCPYTLLFVADTQPQMPFRGACCPPDNADVEWLFTCPPGSSPPLPSGFLRAAAGNRNRGCWASRSFASLGILGWRARQTRHCRTQGIAVRLRLVSPATRQPAAAKQADWALAAASSNRGAVVHSNTARIVSGLRLGCLARAVGGLAMKPLNPLLQRTLSDRIRG